MTGATMRGTADPDQHEKKGRHRHQMLHPDPCSPVMRLAFWILRSCSGSADAGASRRLNVIMTVNPEELLPVTVTISEQHGGEKEVKGGRRRKWAMRESESDVKRERQGRRDRGTWRRGKAAQLGELILDCHSVVDVQVDGYGL